MIEEHRKILNQDFQRELRRSIGIRIGWALADLGDEISALPCDDLEWKMEKFVRQRGDVVQIAVMQVCQEFGVPYDLTRLSCNGQRKLLVKSNRVLIIFEARRSIIQRPDIADYKVQLASSRNASRQLLLPFPGWSKQKQDMSGEMLATIIYGTSAPRFQSYKMGLSSLHLGVPNSGYNSWLIQEDMTALALEGKDLCPEHPAQKISASAPSWNIIPRTESRVSRERDEQ